MGGKKRVAVRGNVYSEEALALVLESGEVDSCMEFFRGTTEKQRSALASTCKAFASRVQKNYWIKTSEHSSAVNPLVAVSETALFCTASYSGLKTYARHMLPNGEVAFDILRDRNPPWLGQWATHLLGDSHYWLSWRLVRRMVRELGIDRPEHPNYYLGMISGINQYDYRRTHASTVLERLREDPELLEHEVWKLFEHEGSGENSLANCDRFGNEGWSRALLTLVEEGQLSRERLRLACLEALRSDYNHYRAKWFATFFDVLEIPSESQDAHWPVFLELLEVSAPNIVSWAFKKVASGNKHQAYEADALAEALRPVLFARAKGLVKSALGLLSKVAATQTQSAQQVCRQATAALAHEAPEVQVAAMKVIEVHGDRDDAALVAEIEKYSGLVAATVRQRVSAWIGTQVEAPAACETVIDLEFEDVKTERIEVYRLSALRSIEFPTCIPAARFSELELPRLATSQPVAPIETLEELVGVCAQVLEDAASIEDVERAFDGLSRLCALRDTVDMAPLVKRARHRLGKGLVPFAGLGPAQEMVGLILAWASGESAKISFGTNKHGHDRIFVELDSEVHEYWAGNSGKVLGFLSRRSHALSQRLAKQEATQLLSAPTHTGYWIDPLVLAARVNGWRGAQPHETEVVLALLRLAPDGREGAAAMLTTLDQEWKQAIGYAMGRQVEVGTSSTLWVCAARSRDPAGDFSEIRAAFPEVLADGGRAAMFKYAFGKTEHGHPILCFSEELAPGKVEENCVPSILLTQRNHDGAYMWELGGVGGTTEQSVRWVQSVWPLGRESLFAASCVQLGNNLDWWGAEWQNKAFLEPLLDPATRLGDMGALLLAFGLGAKEPGEHLLAIDVMIAAIEDGRVGSDNLGAVCARLLPSGFIKAGRWAKTLGEVARASSAHALVVKLILEACLEGEVADKGRDFAKLLGLLQEISAELSVGIASDSARAFLATLHGTNKAAKTAKALLRMQTKDGTLLRNACDELLSFRIRAARQWEPA